MGGHQTQETNAEDNSGLAEFLLLAKLGKAEISDFRGFRVALALEVGDHMETKELDIPQAPTAPQMRGTLFEALEKFASGIPENRSQIPDSGHLRGLLRKLLHRGSPNCPHLSWNPL